MGEQTTSGIPAPLVAILRHAKANGFKLMRSTAFGNTDWAWRNAPAHRQVQAMQLVGGWQVVISGKGTVFPESVTELVDVLVAVGYLPAEFATTFTMGRVAAAIDIERMPAYLGDEGWKDLENSAYEAGYERRLVSDRRRREDFTTSTIEGAYQYGYRRAAKVAKSGGAR